MKAAGAKTAKVALGNGGAAGDLGHVGDDRALEGQPERHAEQARDEPDRDDRRQDHRDHLSRRHAERLEHGHLPGALASLEQDGVEDAAERDRDQHGAHEGDDRQEEQELLVLLGTLDRVHGDATTEGRVQGVATDRPPRRPGAAGSPSG